MQDITSIIESFHHELKVLNFQIVITHHDERDKAVIKIVPEKIVPTRIIQDNEAQRELSERIIQRLYAQRSMLKELLDTQKIHPVEIVWCRSDELESNPRTGKTKRILDKRLEV